MRLRTRAGAYAGEIREYAHLAGVAALRTGTAERVIQAHVLVDELHEHPTNDLSVTLRAGSSASRKGGPKK